MCERMIESMRGFYHMTCRCRHELCYSCGAEYVDSKLAFRCVSSDTNAEMKLAIFL
ncbi:putative E3 ubiquitin ligase RBR family [Helianthus anomalus]